MLKWQNNFSCLRKLKIITKYAILQKRFIVGLKNFCMMNIIIITYFPKSTPNWLKAVVAQNSTDASNTTSFIMFKADVERTKAPLQLKLEKMPLDIYTTVRQIIKNDWLLRHLCLWHCVCDSTKLINDMLLFYYASN